jgi:hypothetical protein
MAVAMHVSGTSFTTIVAGQPILIRDMTGRVVSRDRGVIRETYLFDTLGDDTPGGLYLEQLGLLVSGPHPLFSRELQRGRVLRDRAAPASRLIPRAASGSDGGEASGPMRNAATPGLQHV